MGHLQALGIDTMMGSGHFPEVHLDSSSNVAFTDNKIPQAALSPDSEDSS